MCSHCTNCYSVSYCSLGGVIAAYKIVPDEIDEIKVHINISQSLWGTWYTEQSDFPSRTQKCFNLSQKSQSVILNAKWKQPNCSNCTLLSWLTNLISIWLKPICPSSNTQPVMFPQFNHLPATEYNGNMPLWCFPMGKIVSWVPEQRIRASRDCLPQGPLSRAYVVIAGVSLKESAAIHCS